MSLYVDMKQSPHALEWDVDEKETYIVLSYHDVFAVVTNFICTDSFNIWWAVICAAFAIYNLEYEKLQKTTKLSSWLLKMQLTPRQHNRKIDLHSKCA